MRSSLCLAVGLVVTGTATGAVAAPRPAPVCRLVADPAGDLHNRLNPVGVAALDEVAADLVSADVGSDAEHLTAAVRPRDLVFSATTAISYEFYVGVGKATFLLSYSRDPYRLDEHLFQAMVEVPHNGPLTGRSFRGLEQVTGAVDTARDEVRITVPLAEMAPYAPVGRGAVVAVRELWSSQAVPTFGHTVDEAYSHRTYRLGQPSCVTVAG